MDRTEIKWEGQDNDFTAKVGECDLLVEQNELYKWWYWQIDGKGIYYNGWEDTPEEAKKSAEAAFFHHVNK